MYKDHLIINHRYFTMLNTTQSATVKSLEEARGLVKESQKLVEAHKIAIIEEFLTKRYNDGKLNTIQNIELESFFNNGPYMRLINAPDKENKNITVHQLANADDVLEQLLKCKYCFSNEEKEMLQTLATEHDLVQSR